MYRVLRCVGRDDSRRFEAIRGETRKGSSEPLTKEFKRPAVRTRARTRRERNYDGGRRKSVLSPGEEEEEEEGGGDYNIRWKTRRRPRSMVLAGSVDGGQRVRRSGTDFTRVKHFLIKPVLPRKTLCHEAFATSRTGPRHRFAGG